MKKPKMILFDFGETLITEDFDPEKGNAAVYKYIKKNPDDVSLKTINDFSRELFNDIRKCSNCSFTNALEVHGFSLNRYLYEYFNIEFDISPFEIEQAYFNGCRSYSRATTNALEFLEYLKEKGIRVAILSNMLYSEKTLINWIKKDLNWNEFEFIITTSEYVFRKPNKRIFELAIKKARLNADEVWYIGNSSYFDVEASHNAGLYPVWYKGARWEREDFVPDFEYTEVLDFKDMIGVFD
ncbi:MAG: HAD family hydrolase [Oscillospiraceae bacterium]|nr:HAD family hydrolase [Oscillospiraceae bacterium]